MALFLVAHGAWSAGWSWKKMHPLLQGAGHQLITPTCTGLGERAHLANPTIDLWTHIADILAVIRCEDLRDVFLIGHSYGGMVARGVADRAGDRIARLIFLDAYVPNDNESLFDIAVPEAAKRMREAAEMQGEGWRIPPNPMPVDMSEADRAWAQSRRVPQPILTFDRRLRLRQGELKLPCHYIYCKRFVQGDVFRRFYERAQREPGWHPWEIDATHLPHVTAPDALSSLLDRIAKTGQ